MNGIVLQMKFNLILCQHHLQNICGENDMVFFFLFDFLLFPACSWQTFSQFLTPYCFLQRCMQCRRGLAMRILSVRLSVCHTRVLWQNGTKICPDLYTIRKNIYPSFLRRRMVGGGRPLLPEILGQPTLIGAKSPIFNQ